MTKTLYCFLVIKCFFGVENIEWVDPTPGGPELRHMSTFCF